MKVEEALHASARQDAGGKVDLRGWRRREVKRRKETKAACYS
jgi:hypothetical protein